MLITYLNVNLNLNVNYLNVNVNVNVNHLSKCLSLVNQLIFI